MAIKLKDLPEELQRKVWYFVYNYCILQIKLMFDKIPEIQESDGVSYGKLIILKLINYAKGVNKLKFSN